MRLGRTVVGQLHSSTGCGVTCLVICNQLVVGVSEKCFRNQPVAVPIVLWLRPIRFGWLLYVTRLIGYPTYSNEPRIDDVIEKGDRNPIGLLPFLKPPSARWYYHISYIDIPTVYSRGVFCLDSRSNLPPRMLANRTSRYPPELYGM